MYSTRIAKMKDGQRRKRGGGIDAGSFMVLVCVAAVSCIFRFAVPLSFGYYDYVKTASRLVLAMFMFGGASLRLNKSVVNKLLLHIVPPPLPAEFCVYASGVCEAICGIVLLTPGMSETGGALVVLLLWAVFPANIYHALSKKAQDATHIPPGPLYARVVIQFFFLAWAGWFAPASWTYA